MPLSNNYPIGNDSGGQYLPGGVSPTGGQGQGSNTGGAMQSHFGDYHQQQQRQESSPQINSFLQHHSIVGNHNQPSQPDTQVRATPPEHQRQHFLPGPFYTLQQQQAFTQARLAVAAQVQAQQWQQQLAQVQFQAQQHQQQAQVQEAQPQQNIHSFPLAGQPSNTIFGSGVELASQTQLSHSSTTPTAAAMIGMQTALNFTLKAPEQGAQALVAPAVTLHTSMAPSSYSIPAAATTTTTSAPVTVVADSTRKRLSGTKSTLTDGNNSSKSSKAPPTAPKQKPTDNYSSAGGKLQPPDSCVSSGLSSSAAKLIQNAMDESNAFEIPSECSVLSYGDGSGPSTEQKKQSSRDRNREHARCTRLRKKAYVDKLKELVDGLHAERNEDARKRRAAVQRLAEVQELRRKVVNTFLEYHCTFERDYNKWKLIVETGDGENDDDAEEEAFWMKQPVTPYRSFRRCEIQKGNRVLKGIDALIRDSASMAVMIDTIGSRNLRWLQRKRDDFLAQHSTKRHHTETLTATHRTHRAASNVGPTLPRIICHNRQAQHAISSLSSSSGSSTEFGSSSEEDRRNSSTAAKNVTSSSSSNNTDQQLLCNQHHGASNDFHDYNAPSLPDPLPQSGGSSSSVADGIDSDNCVVGKQMCTDSSSGDDENSNTAVAEKQDSTPKKRKLGDRGCKNISANPHVVGSNCVAASQPSATTTSLSLPRNIARAGGISHNIKITAPPQGTTAINALLPNGHANLSRAPATTLPPFVGIGKRKYSAPKNTSSATNNTNHTPTACEFEPSHPSRFQASNSESKIISGSHQYSGGTITNNFNSHSNRLSSNFQYNASSDHNIITFDYGSVASSQSFMHSNRGIEAHYHINEDDMILTDDVLMCPFIFRSREAVRYGALAECVQPGMLRACFSPTSKLRNIEMIFDAMGFCQQLERASGNEGMAHIIPNSLEMALAPNTEEARVITLAQSPFKIVYVNEPWTAMTGFTQLDAEGKDMNILHRDPKLNAEVRSGSEPPHEYASAANGICTSGTYIQYDMKGREILNFMCSYPLSNLKDEVTHILHVCKELPPRA